jgi:hypothetical protein
LPNTIKKNKKLGIQILEKEGDDGENEVAMSADENEETAEKPESKYR